MDNIINEMSALLGFSFGDVTVRQGEGISVTVKDKKAIIEYGSKTELCRALAILKRESEKGWGDFEYKEKSVFKVRSVMLDMSRNGVMRVEAVKKYIAYMAAFGLNMLMLYTEDTYELEEYPFFGYMRGRYTREELKEIDDYAFSLGVELVPCIQTLGHMEQYLRYQEAEEIKDTQRVMLCGEDKTYEFIETAVKFFKNTLRSNKIHIGMDEANDVGTGNYLVKNGYRDRCEIICSHLERVCGICEKYGLKPMMWSDMYCRMGSETDYHYDPDSRLEESVIDRIPDVGMVYWDYYHDSEDFYRRIISNHRLMKKHISFASGVWTWDGLLPNVSYTFKTMVPALNACRTENIDTFIATMWGDGGCETNHFLALFGLAILSEYSFSSEEPTEERIYEMLEAVTGLKKEAILAMDSFNGGLDGTLRAGTQLVWSDILYDMIGAETENLQFDYDTLERYAASDYKWQEFYLYAAELMKIAEIKKNIRSNIKKAYSLGDKEYLKKLSEQILPDLKERYEKMNEIHEKQWKSVYKVFGWEVINSRYLISKGRIGYAQKEIRRYLSGDIPRIEELECKTLRQKKECGKYYKNLLSTSEIF